MGAKQTRDSEEVRISNRIDDSQQRRQIRDTQLKKLLLLGAGESGKSTLLRQMIELYGNGFDEDARMRFRSAIHDNLLEGMRNLIMASEETLAHRPECRIFEGNLPLRDEVMAVPADQPGVELTPRLAEAVETLWEDPGIRETFSRRNQFQLIDSWLYFIARIWDVIQEDFVPTVTDVFRVRLRTTGVVETRFDIDGVHFQMVDVGGQRSERKKWIHVFDNSTAVIFVAAISEYDQVLFEDGQTNRVDESIILFEEICASRYFQSTPIILFLNKVDLFQEKVAHVPLSLYFRDFEDPEGGDVKTTVREGIRFLRREFEAQNRTPDRHVYTHVTCATDSTVIQSVFGSVKDIIIRGALNTAGFA